MKRKYILSGGLAAAILVLDQATKVLVRQHMEVWSTRPVIDGFFNLVHVLNRGAAFGFLNNQDTRWQTYFFAAASLAAIGVLVYLLRTAREGQVLLPATLGLLLGGAVGNLIDRLALGHVTDFLEFYVGEWSWPAFNVADAAISVGAALLVLCFLREPSGSSGRADNS